MREREMAVRQAVALRARLVRQLLAESLLAGGSAQCLGRAGPNAKSTSRLLYQ
jgi:hypothetical protein